jgi:MFS family permease
MGFQFQSIASLSPQLIEAFEADYAAIGTLVGLYLMPGIVVALPGGFLGARFGEKRLSLLGLGLMTLGGLLAAIGDSYALAVVARVLAGTGVVLQFVLMTKMLTDWFADRELFLAMGLYLNGWPVGIALGLVAQAPLAEATSWQAVMLTTAILSLAALALVALFGACSTWATW